MKIKPKKITPEQIAKLNNLVMAYNKEQLGKILHEIGFKVVPIENLSFKNAQRFIERLVQ